ncbi:peroxisomal membrane protein 4 [Ditylenchus destructor]|uniref:Peroxisomal membrane protein 4 n=1 Tax=Ditylenchus destructor TaxID=166010 RepID=A0AAD4NEG2_9BILA|nr:peroxisomal membrane protein 4 [Ditylenchus destructor]
MDITLTNLKHFLNHWFLICSSDAKQQEILAALKGLRNGLVYGVRIRAPHALVMVMLFGQGTQEFRYKIQGRYLQWHPFVAAALPGYFVFGQDNGVNTQINLYLLSRVIYGLIKLAAEKRIMPKPETPVFPIFAATIWGLVLWLFENNGHVLQNSLQSSMTYLYHDSNYWSSLTDFILGDNS